MSKTNTEPMQPDTQASEGLKLDVTVRPIAPMGNLMAFANVLPYLLRRKRPVCQHAFHPG
jgi:hypothetical protein